MTQQEFYAKYRPRLLLFATDAWGMRKEKPSEVGLALDNHVSSLKGLMEDMYKDLCPSPATNGVNGNGHAGPLAMRK